MLPPRIREFFPTRKQLLRNARNLCFAYLVVLAVLTAFQRSFIYFPWDGPTDPQNAGLESFAAQSFTAADDTPILYWESEAPADHAPTLVYFHGNGGGLHMFVPYLKALHEHGLRVAAMEYRGYPGVEGAPTEAAIMQDAADFIRHMHAKYPHNPMIVWGYSLGSGIAVQATAATQDIDMQQLVLEAPFTSIATRAGEMMPWLPAEHLIWDQFNSIGVIDSIHVPLTIIHGTNDPLIPIAHGEKLFEAANHPKTFIRVEGGDHWNLFALGVYKQVIPTQHSP